MTNFRVAIETSLFGQMVLGDALRAVSECGYAAVEVGLSHFDACTAGKADVEALREFLSLDGLGIAGLFALPGWNPFTKSKTSLGISSPDDLPRSKAVRQMRHAMGIAQLLECNTLVSELSGDMDDATGSRRAFKESIEELLPELERSGLTMFFEAHPGDFVEDSYDAVDLLASFGSKSIRYNYCVPHTFILGHAPREIVRNAKGLIGYVHFADTLMPSRVFFSPTHQPKVRPHLHMIPGQGDVDLAEALSSLAGESFEGYLTVQPFSNADEPVKAAKKSKAILMRMLADLNHRYWESH